MVAVQKYFHWGLPYILRLDMFLFCFINTIISILFFQEQLIKVLSAAPFSNCTQYWEMWGREGEYHIGILCCAVYKEMLYKSSGFASDFFLFILIWSQRENIGLLIIFLNACTSLSKWSLALEWALMYLHKTFPAHNSGKTATVQRWGQGPCMEIQKCTSRCQSSIFAYVDRPPSQG